MHRLGTGESPAKSEPPHAADHQVFARASVYAALQEESETRTVAGFAPGSPWTCRGWFDARPATRLSPTVRRLHNFDPTPDGRFHLSVLWSLCLKPSSIRLNALPPDGTLLAFIPPSIKVRLAAIP